MALLAFLSWSNTSRIFLPMATMISSALVEMKNSWTKKCTRLVSPYYRYWICDVVSRLQKRVYLCVEFTLPLTLAGTLNTTLLCFVVPFCEYVEEAKNPLLSAFRINPLAQQHSIKFAHEISAVIEIENTFWSPAIIFLNDARNWNRKSEIFTANST